MFTLEGKLTFINIDQSYLKKLHDAYSDCGWCLQQSKYQSG